MLKTVRLDTAFGDVNGGRFVLNVDRKDECMFDVRRLEGRRWDPRLRVWTAPPTLRVWKKLQALGFSMLEYGGGRDYVQWLSNGAPVRGSLNTTLFGFQQDDVARLQRARRMLNANAPGLGKTHEAIEWAKDSPQQKLVIAPKVILRNWVAEIRRRTEDTEILVRPSTTAGADWTLANPEHLPKLAYPTDDFDLIVDEAHLFTNTKARRTKLTMALAERAKRVLLLTGTPPSQPVKLWPFFVMLGLRQPKEFFPYALRYTAAEHNDFGWDFSGAVHLDELHEELAPFMIRRTKEEVLDDLPEKLFTTILTESGTAAVSKAISAIDDEILTLVSKGHSLSGALGVGALQRLRSAASHAKIETTAQLVADRLPAKHLIFCEFRDPMATLRARINSLAGADVAQEIHGDTRDRGAVEHWFWNDPSAGVLLCQYQVAGLGLNLQCASTVVIHDLPWTPDQLDQAIDRAHRIGQRDSVHVMTVLSRSRVEGLMLTGIREGRQLTKALYAISASPASSPPGGQDGSLSGSCTSR